MKNHNPSSGLKQISRGYLYIPRDIILDLIRHRGLKLHELGFFLICLVSTDWDNNQYRFGLIRHEIKRLALIWKMPISTVSNKIASLIRKDLLSKDQDRLEVLDFSRFTHHQAQQDAKRNITDEEIQQSFPEMFTDSKNQLVSQRKEPAPFKDSFKSNSDVIGKTHSLEEEHREMAESIEEATMIN